MTHILQIIKTEITIQILICPGKIEFFLEDAKFMQINTELPVFLPFCIYQGKNIFHTGNYCP